MGPETGIPTPPTLRNGAEVLRSVLLQHAEQLIALLVEDECARLLAQSGDLRDAQGRHSLVRNGLQPERTIGTGIGPVRVRLPKFRSRTGAHVEFRSLFVPRFARCAADAEPGAAWHYLHAMIRRDIPAALSALLGTGGAHASVAIPATTRSDWAGRCDRLLGDALDARQWTRIWAFEVEGRANEAGRIPDILVVLGEDPAGRTRLLSACNESGGGDPWAGVLRDLRARGLEPSMDAWVVSTCALGIVETMKACTADTFRPGGREHFPVRSGNAPRARPHLPGAGTWISALLMASGLGVGSD
jgi:hypothetical protein